MDRVRHDHRLRLRRRRRSRSPASLDDINVGAALGGLAAGTTYHARIVISSTQGSDPGDDVAFTTHRRPRTGRAGPCDRHGHHAPTTVGGGTTTAVKKVVKKAVKKSCIVPKVTGKTINKARSTVYAKGCKVQVKYAASKKPNNMVIAQSRKAGKKLGFRAVVKLTVAKKAAAVAKTRSRRPEHDELLSRDGGPGRHARPGPSHARLESACGPIAQLVEQGTFNPKVAGSSPARPIPDAAQRRHPSRLPLRPGEKRACRADPLRQDDGDAGDVVGLRGAVRERVDVRDHGLDEDFCARALRATKQRLEALVAVLLVGRIEALGDAVGEEEQAVARRELERVCAPDPLREEAERRAAAGQFRAAGPRR